MTIFVIGKLVNVGKTGACLFATHGFGSGFGVQLFMTSTGLGFGAARYSTETSENVSGIAVINSNVNTDWSLYVCEIRADGNYVRNITKLTQASYAQTYARVLTGAKCRIGANYSSTYDGQTNILAVVAHNTSLSEVEIQKWIVSLRKYAASRGITV